MAPPYPHTVVVHTMYAVVVCVSVSSPTTLSQALVHFCQQQGLLLLSGQQLARQRPNPGLLSPPPLSRESRSEHVTRPKLSWGCHKVWGGVGRGRLCVYQCLLVNNYNYNYLAILRIIYLTNYLYFTVTSNYFPLQLLESNYYYDYNSIKVT